MAVSVGGIADELRLAVATLRESVGLTDVPAIRIGVTGLSRSGKTVFITALTHALIEGHNLPLFRAFASGRVSRVRIVPQPDAGVPRFQVEDHVRAIIDERRWPDSTRAVSQMRLLVEYERDGSPRRRTLAVDIIDYPGEWLLDLSLLDKDFAAFSHTAMELAGLSGRAPLARDWLSALSRIDSTKPLDEPRIAELHGMFVDYLRACRENERAFSTLPPGRFLMPGDLEGSPALTFFPLPELPTAAPRGSLADVLSTRFEAYKDLVVRPFFRDHFVRLDRQVVLVDALQALNAGPEAVADVRRALADILTVFRIGRAGPIARLFSRRIDKIVLAATKADHLHREDHDRLQALVRSLVDDAITAASDRDVEIVPAALAAVRATREARSGEESGALPLIVGTPMAGERIGERTFDGSTETAVFPGDLPRDVHAALRQDLTDTLRFVRFRPPRPKRNPGGAQELPHIRLDRVVEELLGDRL